MKAIQELGKIEQRRRELNKSSSAYPMERHQSSEICSAGMHIHLSAHATEDVSARGLGQIASSRLVTQQNYS